MAKSKSKFTEEELVSLESLYNELAKDNNLEPVVEHFNKLFNQERNIVQIRGALVYHGIYNASRTKPAYKPKKQTKDKKTLLIELEKLVGFNTEPFKGSTVEGLDQLVTWAKEKVANGSD